MPLSRFLRLSGFVTALALLAACAGPPELNSVTQFATSDAPVELLPLDELLALANSSTATPPSSEAVAARADRLRARAAAIETP